MFQPIANWDQIAQTNIFPGESGGDYDALFGYQNRPGGRYENVRVSQMPLRDVMAFSDPKGGYGQGVKADIGRVATPMGAYQVVGTTLREAVRALGLDPSRTFDKETQDLIGQWIYQNQGPGAWEAWGKGGGGGDMVTRSTKNGPSLMDAADDEDFPMFEMPELSKGQKIRGTLAAVADALAAGGRGTASNFAATDAFLHQMGQGNLQKAAAEYKQREQVFGREQLGQQRNQTVQWLMSQGRQDLADAVASGTLSGEDAAKIYYDEKGSAPQIDPATGLPMISDEQLGNINTLRDDIRVDLAPYMETENAARNIFSAANGTGGTSDFTMAQQFAKLLDPTSVVREGELAAVMSSTGTLPALITRIEGELEMNGGKLPQATKDEILRLTQTILEVRRQSALPKMQTYQELARRSGLDPALLGIPSLAPLEMPTTTTQPPPPGEGIPLPEDF